MTPTLFGENGRGGFSGRWEGDARGEGDEPDGEEYEAYLAGVEVV